ncbi:unnamed protein product [Effrenium voratum]|nr:unnamed protein product [Effrenium voratum]
MDHQANEHIGQGGLARDLNLKQRGEGSTPCLWFVFEYLHCNPEPPLPGMQKPLGPAEPNHAEVGHVNEQDILAIRVPMRVPISRRCARALGSCTRGAVWAAGQVAWVFSRRSNDVSKLGFDGVMS